MSQKTPLARKPIGAMIEPGISLNCFFILGAELNNKETKEQSFFGLRCFVSLLLNFYRVNFQPHHFDVDFVFRIRRMFGDITLRDGGNEFFAQIF
jgi:hypothetical protein